MVDCWTSKHGIVMAGGSNMLYSQAAEDAVPW